ncbi:Peptidoglycan/xylan/chitin deacetylase, PgdA/CDA1 family [Chitinophaga eiseniae]|uniref:Peptidoglycan/xylan/chitin deacetylase, PgdA/CDA1 family n=1 Tax=Chitinophaga eiseniae TaxID=634771 RepID=A0A1T4SRG8_9BACT|nr:polysaccharide deacetylase family protein [Chitinophaga eiseniae]SKA30880.1 Peptidoglycan/xylan/chitin deacetylase, PgdA/CDA1 family [Chitinophaga eiseniae]
MKMFLVLLGCCLSLATAAQQLPVLCYHNITTPGQHQNDLLHIDSRQFELQLKTLADSGYHTILPDEMVALLQQHKPFPARAFMITFDDSHDGHYSIAAPLLQRYHFKGVFFVMTVTVNKPHYLSVAQIKALSENGHAVESHTWDHPRPDGYHDWDKELLLPRQQLEKITGRPVRYIAYPFGAYNDSIIRQVKLAGYKAAFQLNRQPAEGKELYTLRRMLVDGRWSGTQLLRKISRYVTP